MTSTDCGSKSTLKIMEKNLEKILPTVGTELGTSAILVWCSPVWANLELLERLGLFRSLYSHALLEFSF